MSEIPEASESDLGMDLAAVYRGTTLPRLLAVIRRCAAAERERDRLAMEVVGEGKSRSLLSAGLESVSTSRDELKHRCRELERERDELRAKVARLESEWSNLRQDD